MREDSLSSLSALLDGECPDAELDDLLDEMERSPELAAQWSLMCRDQDLRQGRVLPRQTCICADVMSRLDEPESFAANVRPLRPRMPALRLPRWAAPVSGLVAAASMGAAAVLLVQPDGSPEPVTPGGATPLVASGERVNWVREPNSSVATMTKVVHKSTPVAGGGLEDPNEHLLREYLIDHSNAVAAEGMGGTMRYARFAAHEAEYRPMTLEFP